MKSLSVQRNLSQCQRHRVANKLVYVLCYGRAIDFRVARVKGLYRSHSWGTRRDYERTDRRTERKASPFGSWL